MALNGDGVSGQKDRVVEHRAATSDGQARGQERVLAVVSDDLPTPQISIRGRKLGLKLDTCAACSVAGSNMKRWGVKMDVPRVDVVYGLGGTPF